MATRQNYQPYVPPYKRNALKSDESCSDTNSKSENKGGHLLQSLPSKSSEENLASDRNNNKINKSDSFLKRLDSSTLVNNKVSDSDLALVLSCCLLVSLKDSSVNSQNEKESLIHPFHEEKSSVSFRWVSPSQALVVYMNEGIALAYKEKCANPRLSIIQLTVSMAPQYYSVAKELYDSLKPLRSTNTANRLIGAALGIKIKSKSEDKKMELQKKDSSKNNNNNDDDW